MAEFKEECEKWIEEHKKTWLKEKLSFYDQDCESEYNEGGKDGYKAGATEVCKKILEEADNRFNHSTSVYSILEDIIKDLGIKVCQTKKKQKKVI